MTDVTMGSDGFPATLEIAAEEEEDETAQRPKTKAAMAKSAMETSPPPLTKRDWNPEGWKRGQRTERKLHWQETTNSVRGRKSMYKIQATVAMEQWPCTRSCKGFWQHFTWISTRSSQDLDQDIHASTPKRISQNRQKKDRKGPGAAGALQDLDTRTSQEPPARSEELSYTSTSSTWHLQDLHARTS